MWVLNTGLQMKRWNTCLCFLFLSQTLISCPFHICFSVASKAAYQSVCYRTIWGTQVSQLNYSSHWCSWSRFRIHSFTDFIFCLNVEWHQMIHFVLVFDTSSLSEVRNPKISSQIHNFYALNKILIYCLKDFSFKKPLQFYLQKLYKLESNNNNKITQSSPVNTDSFRLNKLFPVFLEPLLNNNNNKAALSTPLIKCSMN